MAETYSLHIGNGSTKTFAVTFPYIEESHVRVSVNLIEQVANIDYIWSTGTTIEFTNAPPQDAVIAIRRFTSPDSRLVDFQNGAVLTEADLDAATLQNFYLNQEVRENYQELIDNELARIAAGNGITYTDPDSIVAGVVEAMLSDAAAANLQQRIQDIDDNAQAIIDQYLRLDSQDTTIANFVSSQGTSHVAGDAALQSQIDLMGSVSGDSLSFILDMNTTKVDASTSFAQRLSAIDTSIADNAVAITTEETARIAADGLLEARYGVTLNVNGYITGFSQNNDGSSGTFSILADKFLVVDPANDGQNPTAVFAIQGGNVALQNLLVGGDVIAAGAIAASHIQANTITSNEIAANTITGSRIAADTITSSNIAANAITAIELAAGSVTAANAALANLAVTTAKIADAAITSAKIGSLAVTEAKIAAANVTLLKVRGEDITVGRADTAACNETSSSFTTVSGFSVTLPAVPSGGSRGYVQVTITGECTDSDADAWNLRVMRGGTEIARIYGAADTNNRFIQDIKIDTPGTGATTYTVQMQKVTNYNGRNDPVVDANLMVQELRA